MRDASFNPTRLRGLVPHRPNHVWSADITYVPMRHGFMYLVAILDWYSRYVVAWHLSNTMDVAFCLTALEEALAHGYPEIFNTAQGAQFTSLAFTTGYTAGCPGGHQHGRTGARVCQHLRRAVMADGEI